MGTLTVSRQVQWESGGFEIRPPKYRSVREVYLAQTLTEMLTIHTKRFCPGTDTHRWLFKGSRRSPPHQNTFGHGWHKTMKSAQIEGLKLHELRHYYASGFIAAGCDVLTVQRAKGPLFSDHDSQYLRSPLADR